ncbi:MAG: hypothetical protein RSF69_01300 [Erysipelotrichaceae bacterium]
MRKLLLLVLCFTMISGCSSNSNASEERSKKYDEYVKTVEDNSDVVSNDIPFDHALEVHKVKKNLYQYTVTIDNPKIAMYNIEEIVVDKKMINGKIMFPNVGIIDDEDAQYNLIPFQSNNKKGFQKGIQLSGETSQSEFTLYVLVTWKDYAKLKTSKAFFNYHYDAKQVEKTAGES